MANNVFDNNEKKAIKIAKIMTKDCKYLIFAQLIKFNRMQIELDLNDIILIKKSYTDSIFLVIGYNIDSINLKYIIKTKLSSKKYCIA